MAHIKLTKAVEGSSYDLEKRPTEIVRFELPFRATANRSYRNIDELRSAFRQEEIKQKFRSGKVTFQYDQDPSVANCMRIKVYCVYCRARIYYKLDNDRFIPTKIENHHTHTIKKFADKTEESLFRYERDRNRDRWIKRKMKREVHMGNPETPIPIFGDVHRLLQMEKFNSFAQLKEQLDNHDCVYRTDPPYETGPGAADRYPRMMVIASKLMLKNYSQYGDLLSFDITYNLLRNLTEDGKLYRLGVFCVTDTNIRILMAGIALMTQQNVSDFYKMFDMFFQIHGCSPQPETIITDQQKTIQHAIEQLRHEGRYTGIHIFDPFHMINNIRENLKGEEQRVRACVKVVSDTIKCRNLKQHTQLLFQLSKDVQNSQIYDQFRDRAQKICYWQIPRSFIGINRFSCQKINDVIKVQLPYETTINILMERILRIDQKMHLKSVEGYRQYRQRIEEIFCDERIKIVRYHYEVKIFERFIENYMRALYEVEVARDDRQLAVNAPGDNYNVRVVDSGEVFAVRNWACECEELDKTGVPCVHIIACARSDPNKEYHILFRKRWWKEVPILSSDPIIWTKRTHPKPQHHYKTKPALTRFAQKFLNEIQNAAANEPIAEVSASEEENSS